MKKEYRSFKMKIREMNADEGVLEGYASVFNEPITSYNEVVLPGAFKRTLKNSKGIVPVFDMHWAESWLGLTQKAFEDDFGLGFEAKLRIDSVQRAKEIWALSELAFELGNPAGVSIGFLTVKEGLDKEKNMRQLKELNLKEISITPPGFAAAPKAKVENVRSLADDIRTLSSDEFNELMALLRPADGTPEPAGKVSDPDLHSLAKAIEGFMNA